ncbi:YcfL family protein [Rahnella aquatilis]|uniref:Putative periplasmic lipoprotein n=1 Tax=Rahnella aquatilis (strain ATCC 33071 / DSM 4594 / JCM 1683 / NBRC 105701 / NCIMB 13365 / CIP 78.65) TaxID=745277 RepID=H2IU69_RAHAC|nr:YcfL family protein [Rahnella aquatilis]AEX52793.1 putative periplasmic lipoprotein [Rahnella aquatilis CIP 78.65 = ATCC 33071]KFD05348.1 YcfL family salvage pathway lipoprotein [Rahnella aquatilis CIP 78.65 = ATCC 33071]
MRFLMALLPVILLIGCSSKPTIALNNQQRVVMESPVLTAGIIPGSPSVSDSGGQKKATTTLDNNQPHPVTLHYRFYWYDKQGLDLFPVAEARTITVPANSSVDVSSMNGNLDAYSVRIYLYL